MSTEYYDWFFLLVYRKHFLSLHVMIMIIMSLMMGVVLYHKLPHSESLFKKWERCRILIFPSHNITNWLNKFSQHIGLIHHLIWSGIWWLYHHSGHTEPLHQWKETTYCSVTLLLQKKKILHRKHDYWRLIYNFFIW